MLLISLCLQFVIHAYFIMFVICFVLSKLYFKDLKIMLILVGSVLCHMKIGHFSSAIAFSGVCTSMLKYCKVILASIALKKISITVFNILGISSIH